MTTESGILLTWTTANASGTIYGYNIYRKVYGQGEFVKIGSNSGEYNNTYADADVISETVYSYQVRARGSSLSEPSNTKNIAAPILTPSDITSFDVEQHSINDVESRWTLDPDEYYEDLILKRKIIGVNSDYVQIATLDPTGQHYYNDHDITPGKKIIYQLYNQTQNGQSNEKYDFLYAPYRDISISTPVYIRAISFTSWDFEAWYHGFPEFKITMAGANPSSNTSYPIQDKIRFDWNFGNEFGLQYFNNRLMLMWQTGAWQEMLSFHAVEYDNDRLDAEFTFNAKFKRKDADKKNFAPDGGIAFKYDLSSKDYNLGNSYYTYYDPTSMWLVFPECGFKILVSTEGQ